MSKLLGLLLVALFSISEAGSGLAAAAEPEPGGHPAAGATFTLVPLGRIEKQGSKTRIILEPEYRAGLQGLEEWSHVWVFYWFDQNDTPEKRATLQVHPRGNPANPRTGVFATRSPVRPNLLALSLCRLISVQDGIVEIESIDAFDQTPVVDLKPYAPGPDHPQAPIRTPAWVAGRQTR